MLLCNILSNIFPAPGSKDIGQQFFKFCSSLFLCAGTTLAFFHSVGNFPFSRHDPKIDSRGLQIEASQIFIILIHLFFYKKPVYQKLKLKSDSHLPKTKFFICFNDSPLKMIKNAFYFILKAFSRYLNFCLDFCGMQKKRLDQKDKGNFEMYDVTAWLTKNYNTYIAQYLTN